MDRPRRTHRSSFPAVLAVSAAVTLGALAVPTGLAARVVRTVTGTPAAVELDGGGAWLAAHAWRHGFVVSYPTERSPRFTCYKPEPWHVRYVGPAEARAVHESDLSLREWLWLHGDDPR